MSLDVNPYSPPASGFGFVSSSVPRSVSRRVQLFAGAALGAVSFLIAMALIPSDTASPTTHDLRLANNLGFIYPPLLGLWVGWVRRSVLWAVFGFASGFAIGFAYYVLCGTNFLPSWLASHAYLAEPQAYFWARSTTLGCLGSPID